MINFYNWAWPSRSSPLYPHVAGYMEATGYWTSVQQVRVTCCFPNTPDPSVIGNNNWLAAGMFLQGMDGTTPNQDYGYYSVIVIDSAGVFYLDVGAWMDNELYFTRTLLFNNSWVIQGLSYQTPIRLNMFWDTGSSKTIYWTVTVNGQNINPPGNSFDIGAALPNSSPNKGFTVGTSWESYPPYIPFPIWVWLVRFFQSGITSPQLIEQSGWRANVSSPQYCNTSSTPWEDVAYAKSVEGSNAWLDYDWEWGGKEFTGVNIATSNHNLQFSYTGTTIGDDVSLWEYEEPEGGGCPYVSAWNGTSYALDNNILPASESGNGTDVRDYYALQQPLIPFCRVQQTSTYLLQVSEFEREQDYIDQVKLLAVDHLSNTSVTSTPKGEIVTYANPTSPSESQDNNNVSQLDEISEMDGNVSDPSTYFEGYEGDWLLLNFGRVSTTNAHLIFRDDWKCDDVCIEVQIPSTNNSWQTIEVLYPRDRWATEAVNVTAYVPINNDFVVRLFWTAQHRLDYVGLDTSPPAIMGQYTALPILAVQSNFGIVTAKVLQDDEDCVKLTYGQLLTLAFAIPDPLQGLKRDFIFCTNGYYYTMSR